MITSKQRKVFTKPKPCFLLKSWLFCNSNFCNFSYCRILRLHMEFLVFILFCHFLKMFWFFFLCLLHWCFVLDLFSKVYQHLYKLCRRGFYFFCVFLYQDDGIFLLSNFNVWDFVFFLLLYKQLSVFEQI